MKKITKFLTLVLSLFCVFGMISPVYAEGSEEVTVQVLTENSEGQYSYVCYDTDSDYYVFQTGQKYNIEVNDPSWTGWEFDTETPNIKDGYFEWFGGGADYEKYGFGLTPVKTGETTIEYYEGKYKHVYIVDDGMSLVESIEKEFNTLVEGFTVSSEDEDATGALKALMVQAIKNVGVPVEYVNYTIEADSESDVQYYYGIDIGWCGADDEFNVKVDSTAKAAATTESTDVNASSSVDAQSVVKNAMNNGIFSEEQVTAINDGADTEVKTVISKTEPTAEDKNLVEAQLNSNNTVAMYLDLKVLASVTKDGEQVGDTITVSETGTPVKFTITLDDAYINTKDTVERTYQVVRVHNGTVDVLPASFDAESKTITFETDKFSTYAIMYTDTVKASKTPSTSDTTTVGLYGGMAVVSVLAVGLLFFFKKRNA